MLRSLIIKHRFLLAPDTGAASGGVGNPAANQGGASPDQGNQQAADPLAGINLDDLDPLTRKTVEDAKTKFASLQSQVTAEQNQRLQMQNQAREFQSKFDRLQAQVQGQQTVVDPETARNQMAEKVLIDGGVPPEQAKAQAPIFAKMFSTFGDSLKKEIGRDLAPIGQTVLNNQAESAWHQAFQQDKLAALQIPEVAKATRESVQSMLQAGQAVTPEVILNLRNIHYAQHIEAGGNPQQQQQMAQSQFQPQQQFTQFPQYGSPGFANGNFARQPQQVDVNAPKHVMNADTAAAVAAVTARWGIKGKGGK